MEDKRFPNPKKFKLDEVFADVAGVIDFEFVSSSTNPFLSVGIIISCLGIRTTPRL